MEMESERVPDYPDIHTDISPHFIYSPYDCTFTKLSSLQSLLDLLNDSNCYRHSLAWTVFLCFVYTITFLFGLVGNLVVIYVLGWSRRMRSMTNIFILSLAVADLFVILCCMPVTLISTVFVPWILGETLCKIVPFIQGVTIFVAVCSLVSVSIHRCRTVDRPIRFSLSYSKTKVALWMAVIWIVGMVCTCPWIFAFDIIYLPETGPLPYCAENWSSKPLELLHFGVVHLFICYILPVLIIAYCNYQIWKNVKSRELPVAHPYRSRAHHGPTIEEIQRNTKIDVVKLLSVLAAAFFFCWLPLYLMASWLKFGNPQRPNPDGSMSWKNKLLETVFPLCQVLGFSNSCMNPVLYAFLSKKFRDSVSGMWFSFQNRCCKETVRRRLSRQASGRFYRAASNNNPASLNVENERRNVGGARQRAVGGVASASRSPDTQMEMPMGTLCGGRPQSSVSGLSTQLTIHGPSKSAMAMGRRENREYMTSTF